MNIDSELKTRLEKIVNAIKIFCLEIVLYGSQLKAYSEHSDIDLLVISTSDNKKIIYEKIAELQVEFNQIIHAVIIDEVDISQNEDIEYLYLSGRKLWKNTVIP